MANHLLVQAPTARNAALKYGGSWAAFFSSLDLDVACFQVSSALLAGAHWFW
jgi:hypothetical protein